MRNLLVTTLLLGVVLSAQAADFFEDSKTIVCGDIKDVIQELTSKYEEQPIWNGSSSGSKYILLSNPVTRTWTMVQYDNKVACVIGTGQRSNNIVLPNT